MQQTVIIDGYNVLLSSAGNRFTGSSLEQRRDRLIQFLNAALAGKRKKVIVVFDSEPGWELPQTERRGIVEIRFSRKPKGADDLIAGIAAKASRPLVVSADRELVSRVTFSGAQVLTPAELIHQLIRPCRKRTKDDEKPTPPTENEIAYWEDLFAKRKNDDEEEGDRL
jgi:predicted RNA-binding protein with PIN domain